MGIQTRLKLARKKVFLTRLTYGYLELVFEVVAHLVVDLFVPRLNEIEERGLLNYPLSIHLSVFSASIT